MNLTYLKSILPYCEEIQKIGKQIRERAVIANVMGFMRVDKILKLYILQFDEKAHEAEMEGEGRELTSHTKSKPLTQRQKLKGNKEVEYENPFQYTKKVRIGAKELPVTSTSSGKIGESNWERILLITKFLEEGWNPKELEWQDTSDLFLTEIEFKEEYDFIPFGKRIGTMEFLIDSIPRFSLVEKKMNLIVGKEYSRIISFTDKESKEKYGFYIHRVYLMDLWKEQEKQFENPKYLEMMTVEEFEKLKKSFHQTLSKICPKGMYFPVVEYETEEDISLEFYSKEYLDSKVEVSSGTASCMGISMRPDMEVGKHGKKLKAAVIQTPKDKDTKELEIELFRYGIREETKKIVVK